MSGSKLIELIQNQAKAQLNFGIELATVISPPPDLIIKVDNMPVNLQGDDLIVCEHLLERELEYTTNANILESDMTEEGFVAHKHAIISIHANKQTVKIYTNLKEGDRVAVQALPGGQQYLVIDKVVEMGG